MNEIFKGLYNDEIEKNMIDINMIVFNGTCIYYNAKACSINDFIYVLTADGAKVMYNKSELTMAM